MKTKTAYSYKRFSSVGQSHGSSIERQLEEAQSISAEKGWKFVDLPSDRGLSGFTSENKHKGALGLFLRKVTAGEVEKGSVLIIEKMDRFSRNEVDLVLPDFLALLQSGIEIFSCIDRSHYTLAVIRQNPMMLNYAVMAMAMANDFSKTLSKRISNTFALKYAAATKGQKVNFGNWQPRWIDFVNGSFKFNKKAETVSWIIQEYLKGTSMLSIASQLNQEGTPAIGRGKRWTQGQVGYLLQTEGLLGHCEIKGHKYSRYYPALITDDDWNKLQAKLRENTARKGGNREGQSIANLFRNRCRCSKCGGSISTQHSDKGRVKYYYKCQDARYGKCDVRKMMPVYPIEQQFFFNILQETPTAILGKQTTEYQNELARLKTGLAHCDKVAADISELIGSFPISEIKTRLGSNEVKREGFKQAITELNYRMAQDKSVPGAIDDLKAVFSDYKDKTKAAQAIFRVVQALEDPSIRAKLLNIIPSIVNRIDIDLEKRTYSVTLVNGEVIKDDVAV